jgi:three-Cys-motif partner protein
MEPGWPGQRTGFFDQQSEWGKYKHQILRKYLRGWVYKLGKAYPELAFIDGCAGEGAYGDGSPGSPLIAVKWNDEQVTSGRGGRLVVHAVEADQESAARLRGVLRPWLDRVPPQAIVYVESLEVRLPLLLERTREVPTLVFIDPYGLGPLSKDKLEPLLRDRNRAPTEILVRADPVLLARWAGWADERPRDARGARTAQSFRDKLKGYNINPEVVGGQFNKGLRPTVFDLFNAYLTIFQDRFQYVQLIPIRPSYYAAPKYFLVHGTDSPHGAALINDTVSTTEDQLFTRTQISEAGGQGFLFQPERNLRVGLEDAETAILTFLTGSRGKRWIEVRAELAMRFGPDLREKYHRTALRGLLERGLVTNLRAEKLTDKSLLSISPKDI